ncbi:hypothetical protein KR054_006310 [Drosophila jambulina]|nr:hypothetical protein KR054_006310 [Drosophila jambulina]
MASDKGSIRLPWRQHRFGEQFREPFPSMSRPKCIGCASITGKRVFADDARNASYLYGPPFPDLPLDLNAGIADVIRKQTGHEQKDLEFVLRYIQHHKAELLRPIKSQPETLGLRTHFVTLRGILRQIMCLQYERNSEFRVKATLLNGTIYMAKEETETQRLRNENMTTKDWNMCSWGFKFEQYITCDHPQSKPVTDVPVNEGEEFLVMFSSQLSGIDLLYGAEVDCVASKEPVDFKDPKVLDSLKFVELKTSAYRMSPGQRRSFDNYKSANWWSQSFLVNIETIYVGLRDQQGMVRDIQEYNVRQLARNKPWSPSAMTWFLVQFLNQLKALMEAIDDPHAVVQVVFNAIDQNVSYQVLRGEEHQILPDWYRDILKAG